MSPAHTASNNPLLARPTRPLPRTIAVIGAGTIGPDIAYYLASALPEATLVLVDVRQEALDSAMQRIEANIAKGVARRKMTPDDGARVRAAFRPTLDYGDIAEADWVLEAATEDLALKRRIFAQVEALVRPDAVLTSNTSSLPAARVFAELKWPSRATITHFFAPAFSNPAVEVVAWEHGDPEVLALLRWLFAATGKVPLVTSDALCFMLDRVFDNWCNEAALLLDSSTAAEIDTVAAEMVHAGPFYVLNLAHGNPIIVETNTLQMEEGEHYRPADIFRSVDRWQTTRPGTAVPVAPETAAVVRDRLQGVLFSQAFDILDRGIGSPADLDLGCCLALGFKNGPLTLMGALGEARVEAVMAAYATARPGMPGPSRPVTTYQAFRRHVLVDDMDGVRVLTMRRPQAMNALDDHVTDELLEAIREAEDDPAVRGFVITGYGQRAFCAGADIGRFPALLGDAEASAGYARDCARLLLHLDVMHKPVVAALNGMALGGGLELAVRCHGIVATRDAWMQFPEVNLGIAPGLGGMVVPFRRWPAAAGILLDMLRTGARLSAREAAELGVVDALSESVDGLTALAVARVGELSAAPRSTGQGPVELPAWAAIDVAQRKQPLSRAVVSIIEDAIVAAAQATTLHEALEVGYRAFGASACTAAATEGIGAFLQHRAPDFLTTG